MKLFRIILPALLFLPSISLAQEVRVRLRAAHPPASVVIQATQGVLHWRRCPTCEEQSGQKLSIAAPATGAISEGSTGPEFFVTGRYEMQSEGAPSFFSAFPLYVRQQSRDLLVVVTMPVEAYVEHVLMAESGDFRNPEAMKAMAVATRTYATKFAHQHEKEGFDFCDTTHCQVFHWREANDRLRGAVAATTGKILSYQGAAAATFYHQNCGGTTAAASEAWRQVAEPYLTVHSDPYCSVNGGLKWETALTQGQIDKALRSSGIQPPAKWNHIEIRSRTKSGRAQTLSLAGGPENATLSASSLRFAVNRAYGWNNVRSDLYDVRDSGDKILFSGRGAGHGVGLCQSGAEEMARQGKSYREILSFYYPGTELTEQTQESWEKRSEEQFELLSTRPDVDSEVISIAKRLLKESEDDIGWKLPYKVRLQVYASLDSYRNETGQPGWVAASTRGRTIRLQPLTELRKRGVLESTLRHELTHLLIESHAANNAPLWFREGIVLYLSRTEGAGLDGPEMTADRIDKILSKGDTQENTRRAYQSAYKMVAGLVQKYGKQKVLSWLSDGLPGDVVAGIGGRPALTSSH